VKAVTERRWEGKKDKEESFEGEGRGERRKKNLLDAVSV
jgi:hypothetical protein